MSVLVYAENSGGSCKKPAFEAVTFAKKTAELLSTECIAVTTGSPSNAAELGTYGASVVKNIDLPIDHFDDQVYATILAALANSLGSDTIILSHSGQGKALAGRLAIRLNAGLVSAVNSAPTLAGGLTVTKSVYSGKAVATISIQSDKRVITVQGNSMPPEKVGAPVSVEAVDVDAPPSRITVETLEKESDAIPLPEAELVVSGGRGLKGPENWGIIEALADELGAATACSRPVADSGWRPHHEHVGQTGVAIRPNLYIAIGISGAIQHLGGVNNSKTIVVINKDPEAPFFKAADYGVVGDLFDVVPRLTEAVKKFRSDSK
ncbi:MAG: electron transfer flavoprotein subunit alpha/FixB family protein [Saprospiraceae bacterium]|nr:electron transfer flavoprotein subunit alpha/FixB family protein [Saprospiraceae bacterium]